MLQWCHSCNRHRSFAQIINSINLSEKKGRLFLYNIWDSRAEGLAIGTEEPATHAGLMDEKTGVRELVWIMLACRCAQGLGGLKMHSNEFTLEESVGYGVKWWAKPIWTD